jgi:uncharacterized alkaline shock family protein YloU
VGNENVGVGVMVGDGVMDGVKVKVGMRVSVAVDVGVNVKVDAGVSVGNSTVAVGVSLESTWDCDVGILQAKIKMSTSGITIR